MGRHRHECSNRRLNGLFTISRIANQRGLALEDRLGQVVHELPAALRFADTACAGIRLDSILHATGNFRSTPWMIRTDIMVYQHPAGLLEIGYAEHHDESEGDCFLEEERQFIAVVAELVGRMIERHRTETAYRESENRFRSLVEGSLTGISIVQDDQVVYQNPEQERLLGPLPRFNKLLDRESIHPEDADKVDAYYRRAIADSTVPRDIDFRFYPHEHTRSGGGMKWVHCRIVTTQYQGKRALLVNMMDVTPAKEMEHLLRVRDRMSSLGRVAAGIAHEIRNPLSGINIYLNTLEKIQHKGDPDTKVVKILTQLQSASSKIESVIKRVMDFSKPGVPRLVLCDPNQPIREAVSLSQTTLRKSGIRLEVQFNAHLPDCLIDPTRIEEVVLNLITNAAEALKATDRHKTIRIASALRPDGVRITVSDTGPGIPKALRSVIFDPFYTTKGGNTGIGLSMSQRIVSDHGGRLRVNPVGVDGGAEFFIDLPTPGRQAGR
jgi:PAS domain S-box-containing protein